jgi:hypothetical protein
MPTMMVGMRETGPFSCPWQLSLGREGCCWYSTPALLQPGDCSLATKSRMSEGRRERKGAPNQASKRRWRSSRAPGTQYAHTASRAHTPRPSDTHPDAISPRSEAPCHAQPSSRPGRHHHRLLFSVTTVLRRARRLLQTHTYRGAEFPLILRPNPVILSVQSACKMLSSH